MLAVKLETLRQVPEVEGQAQAQQDKCCDDDESGNHEKLFPGPRVLVFIVRASLPRILPWLTGTGCALTQQSWNRAAC